MARKRTLDKPKEREGGRLILGDARDRPATKVVMVSRAHDNRVVMVQTEGAGGYRCWHWELEIIATGDRIRKGTGLWWSAGDAYGAACDALGLRCDLGERDRLNEEGAA